MPEAVDGQVVLLELRKALDVRLQEQGGIRIEFIAQTNLEHFRSVEFERDVLPVQ